MASRHSFVPPPAVRSAAALGLQLRAKGFEGGTETGWRRARQLSQAADVPLADLATMRAWFARHGPDAANGGTSYRGYRRWVQKGRPQSRAEAGKNRGAVAWLIWGGDAAYLWLKSQPVRAALQDAYPQRKPASLKNNLADTR